AVQLFRWAAHPNARRDHSRLKSRWNVEGRSLSDAAEFVEARKVAHVGYRHSTTGRNHSRAVCNRDTRHPGYTHRPWPAEFRNRRASFGFLASSKDDPPLCLAADATGR